MIEEDVRHEFDAQALGNRASEFDEHQRVKSQVVQRDVDIDIGCRDTKNVLESVHKNPLNIIRRSPVDN